MDGIADYSFVQSLGDSAHDALYLAHTPARLGTDRPLVRVKVIAGASDEEALRRATRELRAFAAVKSPHLVQLLDAGRDGGLFFYAMEHCPYGSLESPARSLSRRERLGAVAQSARGAHALHEAGLVHRGIRPGNILLAEDGARLADLGLALQPERSMTGVGSVSDIEYIEPDILLGGDVSVASDIWSIGVTLHRVVTGTGVYGDLPLHDPLLAVRRLLKQRPSLADGLEPSIADLILRCLDPDRARRPKTALSMAEEIEGMIDE